MDCFLDLNCINVCGLDTPKEPTNVLESELKTRAAKRGGLPVGI